MLADEPFHGETDAFPFQGRVKGPVGELDPRVGSEIDKAAEARHRLAHGGGIVPEEVVLVLLPRTRRGKRKRRIVDFPDVEAPVEGHEIPEDNVPTIKSEFENPLVPVLEGP